jgi:hypothetical protein
MTTYANLLAGHASTVDPKVTPRVYRVLDDIEESVFNYAETASDRAGIGALTDRLAKDILAIIGLGGTGSYILDLVAKTPAPEIRMYDGDDFFQHNAFRAPGAPGIDELRQVPKKVDYYFSIYSRMRKNIIPHSVALDASNVHLLDGVTFAFVSMDPGPGKRAVVDKLLAMGVDFVDVGMGLELTDGSLGGILRVTTSTGSMRAHFETKVSMKEHAAAENLYDSNIQVADLNALNAVLAVIRWKKLRGFYRDLEREHHCSYTTDGNSIINAFLRNEV